VSPHGALAEVVPAAPAAVGLALAVAGLLAFTAFLIATGMGKLYAETLGAFIRWLASRIDVNLHIPHFGGHPFRSLSHGLYAADTQIRNAFAAAALRFESAASWCFTTAGNTIVWMARETADLAHEVWGAVQHTTVAAIPNALRRAEAVTLARLRGIDHAVGPFVPLLLQDACALVRQYERLAVAIQPALAEFVLGVEGWVCGGPKSLPSGIVAGDLKRVASFRPGSSRGPVARGYVGQAYHAHRGRRALAVGRARRLMPRSRRHGSRRAARERFACSTPAWPPSFAHARRPPTWTGSTFKASTSKTTRSAARSATTASTCSPS
jgi:hypothetical protein